MTRRAFDLWSPAVGASGGVLAYGTWGRPVLVFPSEAGKATDFESNGMVDAVADLLDAGRVKLYCVDSYDSASWSGPRHPAGGAGPAARRVRVVDPRPGRPLDPRRLRRPAADPHPRREHGRLPRRQLRPPPRRPVPAGPVPLRQLRPDRRGTAGASRATRSTSRTPPRTSRTCTATTWRGCATTCTSRSCAGRACGRTPPARRPAPASSRACSRRRTSRTSWTSGVTTSPTTGRGGGASSPITFPDVLSGACGANGRH